MNCCSSFLPRNSAGNLTLLILSDEPFLLNGAHFSVVLDHTVLRLWSRCSHFLGDHHYLLSSHYRRSKCLPFSLRYFLARKSVLFKNALREPPRPEWYLDLQHQISETFSHVFEYCMVMDQRCLQIPGPPAAQDRDLRTTSAHFRLFGTDDPQIQLFKLRF